MRCSTLLTQFWRPYLAKEVVIRLHLVYLGLRNAWITCKKMYGVETVLQKSLYFVHELITEFLIHSGKGVTEYKVLSNFTSNLYGK